MVFALRVKKKSEAVGRVLRGVHSPVCGLVWRWCLVGYRWKCAVVNVVAKMAGCGGSCLHAGLLVLL